MAEFGEFRWVNKRVLHHDSFPELERSWERQFLNLILGPSSLLKDNSNPATRKQNLKRVLCAVYPLQWPRLTKNLQTEPKNCSAFMLCLLVGQLPGLDKRRVPGSKSKLMNV